MSHTSGKIGHVSRLAASTRTQECADAERLSVAALLSYFFSLTSALLLLLSCFFSLTSSHTHTGCSVQRSGRGIHFHDRGLSGGPSETPLVTINLNNDYIFVMNEAARHEQQRQYYEKTIYHRAVAGEGSCMTSIVTLGRCVVFMQTIFLVHGCTSHNFFWIGPFFFCALGH